MKLVVVKDMKSQLFLQPNFQRSIPDALRSFEVMANESENMLSKFPNDFRLFHLADFDELTGEITVLPNLGQDLGSVADYQKKPAKQQDSLFKAVN